MHRRVDRSDRRVASLQTVEQIARPGAVATIAAWSQRQWLTAAVAAIVIAVLIGVPTDVIPNPVFGRPVPVTWWSYPVLAVTAVLGGLLAATYVRIGPRTQAGHTAEGTAAPDDADRDHETVPLDRPGRFGGIGGVLAFFAVGCPVCNKLVVLALGLTGARQFFEPIQPYLAGISLVVLAWALRARLRSATVCSISPRIPMGSARDESVDVEARR